MEGKYRVLFVVNPISGGIDKTEMVDCVKKIMREMEGELFLYYTSGENDKNEVGEVIENFKPQRIFVAGGDGTLKLVAEILKNDTIPIGLFPAGSANGLAENIGLPSEIEQIAEIAFGENYTHVDCIEVNEELCLHISDLGLNAALIKNYDQGKIRGKLGYLIQSVPTLIKSDFPFPVTIKIGDEIIQRNAVLLAIANAKKYGTGSIINPDGKFNDGKFELLVFKKLNIPEILKTFQENVEVDRDVLEVFPTSEAFIECDKKVPFQIDGEYRGEVKTVHAKLSACRIKMTVPPTFK